MAINKESIWAVADAIDDVGEKPTLASVRKRLGGGSYTTISEAMTEWHARRATRSPTADPVPEKIGDVAAEFASMVWQVAKDIADGRLQAERLALDDARQQFESERAEAAAFGDQLSQELEAAKGKIDEFTLAADEADAKWLTAQRERDQERARGDRLEAIAQERERTVEMLKGELVNVRADKDAELARLALMASKPAKVAKTVR